MRNFGARIRDFLSLERNVMLASGAVFLLGFGEELWKKFLPKYLEALGASIPVIGCSAQRKISSMRFISIPAAGLRIALGGAGRSTFFWDSPASAYLVYLFGPSWPFVFVGLAFAMAWQSMASPAIFAVIGDALPAEKRAMGFSIQSILKRVPIVIAPVIGGVIIARRGIVSGIHLGLIVTLVIAAVTALLIRFINIKHEAHQSINIFGVWDSLQRGLKRLLISDIFIRNLRRYG